MNSLSLVVPVLNERQNLEQLSTHLSKTASFAEIIVVDGGSTDGSQSVAQSFASKVIDSAAGRAVQMNLGAQKAQNGYLLFLHADTRLPQGFGDEFERWTKTSPAWGFFPVKLDGRHWMFRVIERAISIRSRLTFGASGDQAICVRKDHFDKVGGYPDIPLMEDLAISRQLSKEQRPDCFSLPVVSSSRRWEQGGIVKTVLLMWHLRLLYYLGMSPEKLANRYQTASKSTDKSTDIHKA